MDIYEAYALVEQYIKNPNLIKHSLATEAVMRALARRLCEDEEKWGLAGLLHDLDVEMVEGDLMKHTLPTSQILEEKGVDQEVIEAIKLHNESLWGKKRSTRIQHALAAGENLTGLIVATALVYPDKRLSSVTTKSVIKRMKEKKFAQGANREVIMECVNLGLSLEEFVDICLEAMQGISHRLGL